MSQQKSHWIAVQFKCEHFRSRDRWHCQINCLDAAWGEIVQTRSIWCSISIKPYLESGQVTKFKLDVLSIDEHGLKIQGGGNLKFSPQLLVVSKVFSTKFQTLLCFTFTAFLLAIVLKILMRGRGAGGSYVTHPYPHPTPLCIYGLIVKSNLLVFSNLLLLLLWRF